MNNEERILIVLERMDTRMDKMGSGLSGLNTRMDQLETSLNSRIDELESNMNMEFYAVRTEMDVVNKSLKKEIDMLNNKVDRLLFTKDVEGYDKIDARLMVLEEGYRELKEKIV